MVTAGALLLSLTKDDRFSATATLLFRGSAETLPQGAGFVDPAREAATNEQLVSLPAVAQQTAERLGNGVTAGDVSSSVTIDSSGDADIARISATTKSPRLSADMANAYGEAYIAFRRKADRDRLEGAIALLNGNLEALSPAARRGAAGRALEEQLASLKLALALQTGNAELVQPAGVPSSPSSPNVARNLALGLVVGALFGFLLAALLERLDRRIRTAEEVEELHGLPILARVPKSSTLSGRAGDTPALLEPEADHAFRTLRANLHNFNMDQELHSVLVVGHEPGGGKSTVARHLALAMAEVRDSVVLVEADLQKNGVERAKPATGGAGSRYASENGLSSVLQGLPLKQALITVPLARGSAGEGRRLTVLPAGRHASNPSELLASDSMRLLLSELEERFEFVIVDTPALAVASDALPLVEAVSGVVIVSGVGKSTREGAQELHKQLMLVGGHQLGVVANFAAPNRDGYHKYYERLRSIAHT